jgi:hypothetical protein
MAYIFDKNDNEIAEEISSISLNELIDIILTLNYRDKRRIYKIVEKTLGKNYKKLIIKSINYKNRKKWKKKDIIISILNIIFSSGLCLFIFYILTDTQPFSIEEAFFYFSMAFIISIFPQIVLDGIIYLLQKNNGKIKFIPILVISIIISLFSLIFFPIIFMVIDISGIPDVSFLLMNIIFILLAPQYFISIIISGIMYRIIFYINIKHKICPPPSMAPGRKNYCA